MSRPYTNKAMRSFFGAREGGQARPNNINTPQFLIDAILELWPEGIELDPCSNVNSRVPARNRIIGKEVWRWVQCRSNKPAELIRDTILLGTPKYPITPGGGLSLSQPWPDFTYVNEPYNELLHWFTKIQPGKEHLMLAPCRPNRRWYCEAIGTFPITCWLKPFPFDGHTQAYPTPLGLSYWGTRIKEFNRIFSRYGVVGRMIINV